MTGRIRVEGDTKHDLRNLNVKLESGGPGANSSPSGSIHVAADGTFNIEHLDPGRYGIQVGGLPDGFYTKSIRVGDADVMYSGVDLASGAPGPVDILLSPNAASVSVVARDRKTNQPAPEATVVLVPQEKERLEIAAFYEQAATDRYGRCAFKNVVPGEYKVYAWEDVESTAWMDPEFMKPLEDKGEPVTVGERAQADVRVDLIPADSNK